MHSPASETRCLCCGGGPPEAEPTLISPFVAFRAWRGDPRPDSLLTCPDCGFRFYKKRLSDEEAQAYYDGYRDEAYFRTRNRFEPFYTRHVHDELAAWLSSGSRRADLSKALLLGGVEPRFENVLDFGGGSGALIRDLSASRKAVFDPSGGAVEPGIELLAEMPTAADWSFITCAQVLEHVSDPSALVGSIRACLKDRGIVYLEVPDQSWRSWKAFRPPRALLEFLCRHPVMLLAADVYSTFFRVKFRRLPPFGFVPMREHVNFFTLRALTALAERCGFAVLSRGATSSGSFFLVARTQTA